MPYLVCRLLLEKNFFNDTATTEIYTLSLHDALPILPAAVRRITGIDDDRLVAALVDAYARVPSAVGA